MRHSGYSPFSHLNDPATRARVILTREQILAFRLIAAKHLLIELLTSGSILGTLSFCEVRPARGLSMFDQYGRTWGSRVT